MGSSRWTFFENNYVELYLIILAKRTNKSQSSINHVNLKKHIHFQNNKTNTKFDNNPLCLTNTNMCARTFITTQNSTWPNTGGANVQPRKVERADFPFPVTHRHKPGTVFGRLCPKGKNLPSVTNSSLWWRRAQNVHWTTAHKSWHTFRRIYDLLLFGFATPSPPRVGTRN